MIIVEVLGYGGGDTGVPDDKDKRGQRSDVQDQDRQSRVQVLDAGAMTIEERRKLVEERRQAMEQ